MQMDWQILKSEVEELRKEFPENTYLLYAIGLRLSTMDYRELQINNVLDGPDDKKVDFFHIDPDAGIATIVQSYTADDWERLNAPANKAADLNTTINWLLESDLAQIPRASVRACAKELRDNLTTGEITRLEIFFIHNLPCSHQVEAELGTVRRAAQRLLGRFANEAGQIPECLVREVGRDVVEEWRRSQHDTVSVHDQVQLRSAVEVQRIETPEWHAIVASVPARELVDLNTRYGDALYSANVRDYLGSRESSRNINRQIERTAHEEPQNFWIYNNGATFLTNRIDIDGDDIRLTGISVINGAQTLGSLSQAAARGGLGEAHVLVRAVKCNDPTLVEAVIRYNNTQNPIKAWELRVIDPIQRRLQEEFGRVGITYQLRRGVSRRRASDVHYEKLGPFLSAFYGDPIAAHKNKAELFENEKRYRNLFAEDTHVKNLLFVYRLGNAVATAKAQLKDRVNKQVASEDELAKLGYFRYGAFSFVAMHVCAEVLGIWLADKDARYKRRASLKEALLFDQMASEAFLARFMEAMLAPLHMHLRNQDAYQILKTQAGVETLASHAKVIIEQVNQMKPDTYTEVIQELELL
jgi:AIPR protein